MKRNLHVAAKEYIAVIEKIEKITDSKKLQMLEEKKVELHWEFMGLLKSQGIKFKDRDHAARIAMKIAKEEL